MFGYRMLAMAACYLYRLKSRGINMVTTIYADAFGFIYDDFDGILPCIPKCSECHEP